MQEEHRQLQAELTRLSAQRQQLRMATREQVSESIETRVESSSGTECAASSEGAAAVQTNATADDKGNASDEDKEETANYLQQKLAEIANLKAQFKRVQQITDSTKLIEQHMSSMESKTSSSSTVQQSRQTMTAQSVQSSSSSSSSTRGSALSSETATSVEPTSGSVPDNAELLNAMINMVTDFTSDLRGQEESLRTERLRIKTLKEEIIQRKQGK